MRNTPGRRHDCREQTRRRGLVALSVLMAAMARLCQGPQMPGVAAARQDAMTVHARPI